MTQSAIVTGASGGIGLGIAKRLAKDGFSVVAHYDGNRAKAEEAVKGIAAAGGKAIAVGADISKPELSPSLQRSLRRALKRLVDDAVLIAK